jgi:diguanylate cyclase (GGDEF)-like protein/PAS domain S-box-containing protein
MLLALIAVQGLLAAPVLQTVGAIRHLGPDQSRHNPPVHLRAVVTYYDTVAPNLFVQDATGGIWVDLRGSSQPRPQPGQLLELEGVAGAGFSPYVDKPHWTVLRTSAPPKPIHISYEQAMTGDYDSDWVEMDGVVRSFMLQAEGSVLVIDVVTPTAAFKVRVPDFHGAFPTYLVDAKARFRGVNGTAFNRRNQIVGTHLMMPSLDFAKVLEPANPDPFAMPTSPVDSLRRFSTDAPDVHRVKVKGIVTARFPGQGLYLMDSTGGVYVETSDGAPVQPGSEVEVAGFPALGVYSPVLKSGAIRPTGRVQPQAPAGITGTQALHGGFDAQLVRLRGVVRSVYTLGNQDVLGLESPDHVSFESSISQHIATAGLHAPIGSLVEITGICAVKTDENGNPAAFEMVLRNPADVRILSSAPWLTTRQVLVAAAALGFITLLVIIWVVVLRRQVRRQTRTIERDLAARLALEERYRRTFERNLTGLFIAEQDGAILDCNNACAQILGFADRSALLANPAAAQRLVRELSSGVFIADSLVNSEHHFQRPDGSWGWALSNLRLVPGGDRPMIEGGLVDISERKIADERIRFLAYYDALTGLPNRSLLQDRLRQAIVAAKRRKEKVALLFLDVDWFKHINDSLGHNAGDELLKQVAIHLCTCAREQDTVARLGGDEFIIVLNGVTGRAHTRSIAERLLRQVATGFDIEGRRLNITCSIGIAQFPEHGSDVDSLIKNADAAMYASKDSGRNRASFFSPEMADMATERLTIENNIRSALEKEEFSLVFQPEVDIHTGAVTCCEALLRWNNPELGAVPPDRFIPVAERTGTINDIGEWVLRTACFHASSWREESLCPRVAVNVSEVQLRDDGFCDLVRKILNETGLSPDQLELELTESLLVSSDGAPSRTLRRLRDMGISLAIDDFGTGYSSLGYLRDLPMSKLKIDRSFVRGLSAQKEDARIVAALISMARSLNLLVTAEGVESETQLQILRELGCDQAQGFYLCRPIPPAELAQRIRRGLSQSQLTAAPSL